MILKFNNSANHTFIANILFQPSILDKLAYNMLNTRQHYQQLSCTYINTLREINTVKKVRNYIVYSVLKPKVYVNNHCIFLQEAQDKKTGKMKIVIEDHE